MPILRRRRIKAAMCAKTTEESVIKEDGVRHAASAEERFIITAKCIMIVHTICEWNKYFYFNLALDESLEWANFSVNK